MTAAHARTDARTVESHWEERPSRRRQIGALALCIAVQLIGGAVTGPAVETWYRTLDKPVWTPPDIAFPVVWTVLYVLMALAAWQAWRSAPRSSIAALSVFAFQLTLNLAWSFSFFGLQNIALGFVNIVALALAILATMFAFARLSALAAWLMAPYLVWVVYATALNAALLEINPVT